MEGLYTQEQHTRTLGNPSGWWNTLSEWPASGYIHTPAVASGAMALDLREAAISFTLGDKCTQKPRARRGTTDSRAERGRWQSLHAGGTTAIATAELPFPRALGVILTALVASPNQVSGGGTHENCINSLSVLWWSISICTKTHVHVHTCTYTQYCMLCIYQEVR